MKFKIIFLFLFTSTANSYSKYYNNGISIKLEPYFLSLGKGQFKDSDFDAWQDNIDSGNLKIKELKTFNRQRNSNDPFKFQASFKAHQKATDYSGHVPVTVIHREVGYTAKINIGSHKQPFVDTGSADLWVPSSDCSILACIKHIRFNPSVSLSASSTGTPFKIKYGSGTVAGFVFRDSIIFGGLTIDDQEFGVVVEQSNSFSDEPFDGILGLGFSNLSVVESATPLDNLAKRGLIKQKLFSLFLEHEGGMQSELLLGSVNDKLYKGNITTIPLITNTGYWNIQLQGVVFNREKNSAKVNISAHAIIDSGTTIIMAPKQDAKLFHEQIAGAKKFSWFSNIYVFPCNELLSFNLSFVFGDKEWLISPYDLVTGTINQGNTCISSVQATKGTEWIFGGSFLRNVYSIWDADAKTIGFAKKINS